MIIQIISFMLMFGIEPRIANIDTTLQLPQIVCTFAYTESRFKQDNVLQISPILLKHKAMKYKWMKPLYKLFGNSLVENKYISYIMGITHIQWLIKRYKGNMFRVIQGWSNGVYSKYQNELYLKKFDFHFRNVCKDNNTSVQIIVNHIAKNEIPKYDY